MGVFYNKKVLEDNGWKIPTTIEELENALNKEKTEKAEIERKQEDFNILLEQQKNEIENKDKLLANRRAQIYQLEQKLSKFNKEQKIYTDQLKDQELRLESVIKSRDELHDEVDLVKNQLLNVEEKKQLIESKCSKMEDKINEKNELVESLQNTLEKQTRKTGEQEDTIIQLQDNIVAQSLQLKDSIKKYDELQLNYNSLIFK